jgi:hypothetical protein
MGNSHTLLLFMAIIMVRSLSPAQEDRGEGSGPSGPPASYLGQTPPDMTPELFAPEILAEGGFSEHVYNILPGEEACVFDRYAEYGYPQGEIFISRFLDGAWTEPELFDLFKDYKFVFLPTVSPDGKRWFFTSHLLPTPAGKKGRIPLFFIEKTDSGWTQPVYIGQHIHASATMDGTLYLMVEGRERSRPAYRMLVDGKYSEYEFLEPAEYFMENDAHLVVDPHGQYIIFDSDTRPRIGNCGLFISYRMKDGTWTEPVSMGRHIKERAAIAWISYDGKYIFFKAGDDVYWVDARLTEELKPIELN